MGLFHTRALEPHILQQQHLPGSNADIEYRVVNYNEMVQNRTKQPNFYKLPDNEMDAALAFLRYRKLAEFSEESISTASFKELLLSSFVRIKDCIYPEGLNGLPQSSIHSRHHDSSIIPLIAPKMSDPPFLLVLNGRISIYSGSEGFHSHVGSWEHVGVAFLKNYGLSDFTAVIDEMSPDATRVLCVSSKLYKSLMRQSDEGEPPRDNLPTLSINSKQ